MSAWPPVRRHCEAGRKSVEPQHPLEPGGQAGDQRFRLRSGRLAGICVRADRGRGVIAKISRNDFVSVSRTSFPPGRLL